MKSKKLVIGYAIAVFLLIFVITFNSVCAITQFDVKFETSSAGATASAKTVQERLDAYLKKSFLFFKEKNVYNVVDKVCEEDGTYLEVLSVKKTFPNKVTVSVAERYEKYAFSVNGEYYITDTHGEILAVKEDNANNIGGNNIDVKGFTFAEAETGQIITADEEEMFSVLMTLLNTTADEKLGGIRGRIASAEYISRGSGLTVKDDLFVFTFTEEIKIVLEHQNIVDGEANPITIEERQKCLADAIDHYNGLTDSQKTFGYIFSYKQSDGSTACFYREEEFENE